MDKLSVFEAKARFSEVVARAEQGRQTVITKRGKVVPAIWPLEFANALRQLERRKLISGRQVDTILDLAEPLETVVHEEAPPPRRMLAIARDHDLSAYGASYLDLALRLRYPMACRDGPLRKAVRSAGAKLA